MGARNLSRQDWWWQVGEVRCQQVKEVIGQVFDVQTALHNGCNPVRDTTARISLNETGCLLDYLNQKCQALAGTDHTSAPFCNLCDASRAPVKHCSGTGISTMATGISTMAAGLIGATVGFSA